MLKLSSLLLVFSLMAPLHAAKKAIIPPESAGGKPFSPGVLVDGTLYISGISGADLKTGKVPADFETEVKNTFSSIEQVLKAAGMTFADVVSVQVYLTDVSLFQRMNAVYVTYFKAPLPTRTTVGVAALVSPGLHIEITMTARK